MPGPTRQRFGISVIEVLFAMGVVVIGLVGIASLLPLAGKNAAESIHFADAQALSNDWYGEFSTRGLNFSSEWIMYRDFGTPGYQKFDKQRSTALTNKGCFPASVSGMVREVGRESVCLDPYFFTHRSVEFPSTTSWTSTTPRSQSNWYRPAVFPYYQDTYNPLVDSAYPVSNIYAWDAQPRMARVSVPSALSATSALSMKDLERAFLSTDDVAVTVDVPGLIDDKDASQPPMRVGLSNAKFSALNNYSWLATISPSEPIAPNLSTDSTNFYTVSLVVVHNRDLTIWDPAVLSPRAGAADPPRIEEKPQGEQLMWVEPVSGDFIGGSGGRVRLIGNDGTKDDLRSGDWVMLSRTYATTTGSGGGLVPFNVFRWYRVLSVEQAQEPTLIGTPNPPYQLGTLGQVKEDQSSTVDPFNLTPPNLVWGRDVVLEGPDWIFSGTPSGLAASPTTATRVRGTKTVIERVMTIY